jgi:hypothetical protein
MWEKLLSKFNIIYLSKHLLLAIFLVSLIEILKKYVEFTEPSHIIAYEGINFLLIIAVIVIFPIIEEIAFRLSIKKNSFYWLSILLSLLFLLTTKFIFIKVIILVYIIFVLVNQFRTKNRVVNYIVIFLSALCFLLVHFDNYDKHELTLIAPTDFFLLFFPQLLIAILFTKVRVQTFFLNSVILHIAYNLIILTLSYLFDK